MQRSSETHSRFDTAGRGQLHALPISLSIVAVATSLAAVSLAGTSLPAAAQVVRLGRTTFYQRAQRKLRLTGSAEAY